MARITVLFSAVLSGESTDGEWAVFAVTSFGCQEREGSMEYDKALIAWIIHMMRTTFLIEELRGLVTFDYLN